MSQWYDLHGNYGSRSLWLEPTWDGKPNMGPYELEDGTDVYSVIAEGQFDRLPFSVHLVANKAVGKGQRGDLIWTGGLSVKVASERFVAALASVNASGYHTFPVDVRERNGEPILGYVGLATTSSDDGTDVRHPYGHQGDSIRVRRHVLDAIRAAGADSLTVDEVDDADT